MNANLRVAFTLGVFCSTLAAVDPPNVDRIWVDSNRDRLGVHLDQQTLAPTGLTDGNSWSVFSQTPASIKKHGVNNVDTSNFASENSLYLQLDAPIPADVKLLDVTFLTSEVLFHIPPVKDPKALSVSPGSVALIGGAKNKQDADIYFNGSYTGVVNGDPTYDIDAFAGYMHPLSKTRLLGTLGFYGQVRTKNSNRADPNSFLAYIVYQRVIANSDKWWGPFQVPYLNWRLAGWEFDRSGNQLNFINSPVLTIPFRPISPGSPANPAVHLPMLRFNLGAEFVDVRKSVLKPPQAWHTRGLAGATLFTGYFPEKDWFHSIVLSSSYQARIPSSPEIFFDSKFSPIDPVTHKKGDPPPMLGTQSRHSIDTTLTYNLTKFIGTSFEYSYGSLPPLFSKTDHSFKLGLTFTLQQKSFGRYSILRP